MSDSARRDENERRKARVGLAFASLFFSQLLLFIPTFWALELISLSWLAAAAGLVLPLIVVLIMPRSTLWANRYLIGTGVLTLWAMGAMVGGPSAPGMYWTATLPIVAMMSESIAAGFVWLGICASAPFAGFVLLGLGVEFPPMTPFQLRFVSTLAVSMLCVVLLAIGLVYESALRDAFGVIEQRNRNMRFVLDHAEQGFITVGPDCKPNKMHSAVLTRWFGDSEEDDTLATWLGRSDAELGEWLELGIDDAFNGLMPAEQVLEQLPQRFRTGARFFDLRYISVRSGKRNTLEAVMVVITDATKRVLSEQTEANQRELLAFFSHILRDRAGVRKFFEEAARTVNRLQPNTSHTLRLLHTLKGNSSMFGLQSVANVCHEVESIVHQQGRPPTAPELARVKDTWNDVAARAVPLLGRESIPVGVRRSELEAVESAIRGRATADSLLHMVNSLQHEPGRRIFERLGRQAQTVANKLARCEVEVHVDNCENRFHPERWNAVWAAMVHAVRNAVDHGGQTSAERAAQGKPEALQIHFSSVSEPDATLVTMTDDGQGIDWKGIAARAEGLGLPRATEEDLERALFADGVSTRDEATELSGRGLGMSALREAVEELGGQVHITSEWGVGTRLALRVPNQANERGNPKEPKRYKQDRTA